MKPYHLTPKRKINQAVIVEGEQQPLIQVEDGGAVPTSPLQLLEVKTKEQRKLAETIIKNYHSYVPTYKSIGRRIDWLIRYKGKLVGVIGIGSGTYPPCKDMLDHIGVDKEAYRLIFNNTANNWRFCLAEKHKNLGSRVLKVLRLLARKRWQEKYGDKIVHFFTFVGGGHNGVVYRADNWKLIGETAGLPSHKSSSMKWNDNKQLKKLFVKPTGENKKLIFAYSQP